MSEATVSKLTKECLHLIVQYCNDHRPERQAEFDFCVRRNLDNPYVERLHNLVERATVIPDEFCSHPKYNEFRVHRWMTYRDAIDYANRELFGEMVCIANLDIFLDADDTEWPAAARLNRQGIVLCLSRHEFDGEGSAYKDPILAKLAFAHTQDAWVFRAPLHVEDCEFEIGMLGDENAFAERLRRSGYIPVNAPDRFKILHYDRARGKTARNFLDIHRAEQAHRPENRHPEEEGQYLVPDIDAVQSVDDLLKTLNVPELEKYVLICDIMTRFVKIKNR